MRVVGPGMLLSFMYESMYNYVGLYFIRRMFFAFSVLLGFLLLASPQFMLNASHLGCVDLEKIILG